MTLPSQAPAYGNAVLRDELFVRGTEPYEEAYRSHCVRAHVRGSLRTEHRPRFSGRNGETRNDERCQARWVDGFRRHEQYQGQ